MKKFYKISWLSSVLRASAVTLLLSSPVTAQTFTFKNRSGLGPADAKFYYLGYGQSGGNFYVLNSVGQWVQAGQSGSNWNNVLQQGVVPCNVLQEGQTFTIPSGFSGGRFYLFQVNSSSKFFNIGCNSGPVRGDTAGIFGNLASKFPYQSPFAYSSLSGGGGVVGAGPQNLSNNSLPLYSFLEFSSGTINTSQVDFIGFPVNVVGKLNNKPYYSAPQWNRGVGFNFGATGQVNMRSVIDSYNTFVATLPVSVPGTYPTYPQARYKSLAVPFGNASILLNPGNYIAVYNQNSFSNFFLDIVNNYMWKPGWTGTVDTGGIIDGLPQVTFTGTAYRLLNYPGYTGSEPLYAIRFVATPLGGPTVIAKVLSPVSWQTLCSAGVITNCSALNPAWQIFAGAGALRTPSDNSQFLSLSIENQQAWQSFGGVSTYNDVVARLGLIISQAYNHGVAGGLMRNDGFQSTQGLCSPVNNPNKYPNTSACWADQSNWYPNPTFLPPDSLTGRFFHGDTTQNQFARWLHTAIIDQMPMMTRPTNPANSLSGVMGMGYGFAVDEDPTPAFGNAAVTPSKYEGNLDLGQNPTCNFVVIQPWSGLPYSPAVSNPTPVTDTSCQQPM